MLFVLKGSHALRLTAWLGTNGPAYAAYARGITVRITTPSGHGIAMFTVLLLSVCFSIFPAK